MRWEQAKLTSLKVEPRSSSPYGLRADAISVSVVDGIKGQEMVES